MVKSDITEKVFNVGQMLPCPRSNACLTENRFPVMEKDCTIWAPLMLGEFLLAFEAGCRVGIFLIFGLEACVDSGKFSV